MLKLLLYINSLFLHPTHNCEYKLIDNSYTFECNNNIVNYGIITDYIIIMEDNIVLVDKENDNCIKVINPKTEELIKSYDSINQTANFIFKRGEEVTILNIKAKKEKFCN